MEGPGSGPMDRGLLIVPGMVGVLLLVASACGGGVPPPTDTAAAPEPTTPSAATVIPTTDGGDLVAQGQALVQNNGCLACHSTDGSPLVGPTWKGIYGREETLADGTPVTVNDEYIRESIKDPNAKIVQDFQPNLMPQTFGQTLSESGIEAIIAYIKSLQ